MKNYSHFGSFLLSFSLTRLKPVIKLRYLIIVFSFARYPIYQGNFSLVVVFDVRVCATHELAHSLQWLSDRINKRSKLKINRVENLFVFDSRFVPLVSSLWVISRGQMAMVVASASRCGLIHLLVSLLCCATFSSGVLIPRELISSSLTDAISNCDYFLLAKFLLFFFFFCSFPCRTAMPAPVSSAACVNFACISKLLVINYKTFPILLQCVCVLCSVWRVFPSQCAHLFAWVW